MTDATPIPPYNAGDPKQVKTRENRQALQRKRQADDFGKLLAMPEFRRWLWALMNEKCQIMITPFSSNGSAENHAIGRGDIGRELWAAIEAVDPKLIPQMMIEYLTESQQ